MLEEKLARLEEILRNIGGCVVAYSGGVDSTFLLATARRILGGRVAAITVSSPLHEREETEDARRRAAIFAVPCETLDIDFARYPEVVENTPDRCYHCKRTIFSLLRRRAEELGLAAVVDATQADDLCQRRPGLRALRELGVRSPLAEAGLCKTEIRELSLRSGLAEAERPASPCLATRIPYGTPLTQERLRRVSGAERILRGLGFANPRVRDYDGLARIEVQSEDLERAAAWPLRRGITEPLRDLGYRYVTLDLMGYRTGSMDEVLPGATGEKREPTGHDAGA